MDNTITKEVNSSTRRKENQIFTKTHDILKDEVAKAMFTNEEFFDYAKKLICKILNIDEKCVEKLELAPEYVNQNFDIKGAISDVVYETDDYFVNLEFNSIKNRNYFLKNLKYVFHLVLNQIHSGNLENVDTLKKVAQINFNAFDRFGLKRLVYSSHIAEDESHMIYDDYLQIYDINLEIAKEMWYTNSEKESLEYYLFAISSRDNNTKHEMYEGDKLMAKVVDKMDELKKVFNDDLFYDNEALLNKASYDKGKEDGKIEGRIEGKQEEKVETAIKMIKLGESIEKISLYTSLTIEEIEQIKKDIVGR